MWTIFVVTSLISTIDIKNILRPIITIPDCIYFEDSDYYTTYIAYTNNNISNIELPVTLYTKNDYISVSISETKFKELQNELIYHTSEVVWYNHNLKTVKIWNMSNNVWYQSDDFPYRINQYQQLDQSYF